MDTGKTLTKFVYDSVYQDVINGVWQPNAILTEKLLIERYGVSKSPVREALITLCEERVLRSIPRTGYQVISFTLDDVRQIVEMRQALELFMFDKSRDVMNDEVLRQLQDCEEQAHAGDDDRLTPAQRWEKNMAFHLKLASFAQNDYMYEILVNVMHVNACVTNQYFRNINSPELKKNGDPHMRFILACRAGDFAAARDILTIDTNLVFSWEKAHTTHH